MNQRLLFVLLALMLPAAQAQAPGPGVMAKTFAEVAVYPEREAPAAAQSLNEAKLSAEVSATVVAIPVEVGQVVPRGAPLVRLDSRDFELAAERAGAALKSAQARLDLAESQLRRGQELQARNFISQEALHQRETEVEVLRAEVTLQRAQLDTARRNLAKTTLRSPYRAVVRERLAHEGELAAPGTPLLALVDLSRVEVAARVQVKDVAALQGAKNVDFVALGGRFPLKLLRISPAIDPDARNVEARLAFAGEGAQPGASGRIAWRDPRPHLPPELVARRDGRLGVFVLENGRARFVPLPQAQEGRPAPAELPPGARIAVEGRHLLSDGQPLKPQP
jgi:RND family efflux transporter MFP subunit